jgi:hypothetical protein
MKYRLLFAALAALALGAGPAAAQGPAQANWIESWYQRYLQRTADPTGMQTWLIEFARGASAENVQAAILASDEYYQLHGSNPRDFIVGLYQDVLGRTPSPDEIRLWLNHWRQVRGQRLQVANTFLVAARAELANQAAARFYGPPVTSTTPPPLPVPPAPIVVPRRPR